MATDRNDKSPGENSGMSHDLNNVLSRILAYAERAIRYADDPGKTRAILTELISTTLEHTALNEDHDDDRR